jgi:hypothetical protein
VSVLLCLEKDPQVRSRNKEKKGEKGGGKGGGEKGEKKGKKKGTTKKKKPCKWSPTLGYFRSVCVCGVGK